MFVRCKVVAHNKPSVACTRLRGLWAWTLSGSFLVGSLVFVVAHDLCVNRSRQSFLNQGNETAAG